MLQIFTNCLHSHIWLYSPAFLYGDPHIVSLDGYQYTFNGKGEYVLLETTDRSLEFQGRMVPAKDENGTFIQATVFSAVAIRLSGSDTIQLEVENSSNITVSVNGDFIDFTAVTVQDFKEVRISERVNNTYLVTFTEGITLEVKAENEFLSLIKISLPRSLNGRTRGLLGNFNGNPSDDLVPRNKTVLDSLLTNSSLEDIHNLFGITCKSSHEGQGLGLALGCFKWPPCSKLYTLLMDVLYCRYINSSSYKYHCFSC